MKYNNYFIAEPELKAKTTYYCVQRIAIIIYYNRSLGHKTGEELIIIGEKYSQNKNNVIKQRFLTNDFY